MELDQPQPQPQAHVPQLANHFEQSKENTSDDSQLKLSDFQVVDTLGMPS